MECWGIGILEYWSDAALRTNTAIGIIRYSPTLLLQSGASHYFHRIVAASPSAGLRAGQHRLSNYPPPVIFFDAL